MSGLAVRSPGETPSLRARLRGTLRRMSRVDTSCWIAGAACAFLVALSSCQPPGTAILTFEGELAGSIDGPSVTCPLPGEESDAYGTWRWQGTLDGRALTLTVGALMSSARPDVLLIDSGDTRWAAMPSTSPGGPSRGTLVARIDAERVLHIEGQAIPFTSSATGTVSVKGSIRCPQR